MPNKTIIPTKLFSNSSVGNQEMVFDSVNIEYANNSAHSRIPKQVFRRNPLETKDFKEFKKGYLYSRDTDKLSSVKYEAFVIVTELDVYIYVENGKSKLIRLVGDKNVIFNNGALYIIGPDYYKWYGLINNELQLVSLIDTNRSRDYRIIYDSQDTIKSSRAYIRFLDKPIIEDVSSGDIRLYMVGIEIREVDTELFIFKGFMLGTQTYGTSGGIIIKNVYLTNNIDDRVEIPVSDYGLVPKWDVLNTLYIMQQIATQEDFKFKVFRYNPIDKTEETSFDQKKIEFAFTYVFEDNVEILETVVSYTYEGSEDFYALKLEWPIYDNPRIVEQKVYYRPYVVKEDEKPDFIQIANWDRLKDNTPPETVLSKYSLTGFSFQQNLGVTYENYKPFTRIKNLSICDGIGYIHDGNNIYYSPIGNGVFFPYRFYKQNKIIRNEINDIKFITKIGNSIGVFAGNEYQLYSYQEVAGEVIYSYRYHSYIVYDKYAIIPNGIIFYNKKNIYLFVEDNYIPIGTYIADQYPNFENIYFDNFDNTIRITGRYYYIYSIEDKLWSKYNDEYKYLCSFGFNGEHIGIKHLGIGKDKKINLITITEDYICPAKSKMATHQLDMTNYYTVIDKLLLNLDMEKEGKLLLYINGIQYEEKNNGNRHIYAIDLFNKEVFGNNKLTYGLKFEIEFTEFLGKINLLGAEYHYIG